MRILIIGLSGLVLASCATAPQAYVVDNDEVIEGEYEAVWSHLVEYFAVNNISIETLERDSGLIVARAQYGEADFAPFTNYADCGGMVASQTIGAVQMNVFVREVDEDSHRVVVNTRFTRSYTSVWTGGALVDQCNSRGTIERAILDWMQQYNET